MKTFSRRYYHSSSFKMAALFTLLLGCSAILLGFFLYDFGKQNILRETEAAIDNEIAFILSSMDGQTQQNIIKQVEHRAATQQDTAYLYQNSKGDILAGNIAEVPAAIERVAEGVIRFNAKIHDKKRDVAAKIHSFSNGDYLLVARDIHHITQSYQRLYVFSGIIILFMLLVVLVSFFISIFVVSRINMIANTAKHIMETGDLSRRIDISTSWDDLSNLAQILNMLLDRTELLMQNIKDVSDNIAHDLRTPLTRLRNQLEEMKDTSPSKEDVAGLLVEADHLLAIFNSLLRISNLEKGKRHQAFKETELHTILHDVIELYEPLAEEKRIGFSTTYNNTPAYLGDRDLLFQLFANLIDNALKFSPENSHVSVSVAYQNNHHIISISDHGNGIADADKEKVFDRFYRTDKSRHIEGVGLGLSLVKAVVELHKGGIQLEDNDPGLRVVVVL